MMTALLRTEGLSKSFTLHLRGGLRLPVLGGVDLAVEAGSCVVLSGPSGAGKSTLLRSALRRSTVSCDYPARSCPASSPGLWTSPAPTRVMILAVRHHTMACMSVTFLRIGLGCPFPGHRGRGIARRAAPRLP